MSANPLATLRQTIPRFGILLKRLKPTYRFRTVADIDGLFLERQRITAVLWDVDGTLMGYHARDVDEQFPHIRSLFTAGPAKHAILSNCDEHRFESLGTIFPEVPILRGYWTAHGAVFRRRFRDADTHTDKQIDRLLGDDGRLIRKPSSELIEFGMKVLGESQKSRVLMVGDQYLTDIASANLAGVRSAKVRTFKPDTFPMLLRIGQHAENALYKLLYR